MEVSHNDGGKKMKSILSYKYLVPVAFIVVSLLVITAMPVSANPGLTVSNPGLLATVTPGQTLMQKMTVSIGNTDPATDISVQVYGVSLSLQGGYQLLDAAHDTGPYSARTFITIDKNSLHLDPGGSEDVTATIQVPQNAGAGGRYAVINIAEKAAAGSGVGTLAAIDVPIYLTLEGSRLIQTGKITEITAGMAESGQPVNLLTDFQNTGNIHFKVQGEVTVKNAQGQTVDTLSIPLTASSILPGGIRQLETTIPATDALAIGTYTGDAKVTLQDGTLLDETTGTFAVVAAMITPIASASTTARTLASSTTALSLGTASAITSLLPTSAAKSSISWPIIGGVIAGAIVVILVGLVIFLVIRLQRRRHS